MARKLVDQEEAAGMLGISVDDLKSMRDQGKVYAYRDGGGWKFKAEDIQRLLEERSSGGGDEWDVGNDSVLVSEQELGKSPEATSSTIIGKSNAPSLDSDIHLAPIDDGPTSGSDVKLVADPEGGSDVKLVSDSQIGFSSLMGDSVISGLSDVPQRSDEPNLAESSDLKLGGSSIHAGGASRDPKSSGLSDLMSGDDHEFSLEPSSIHGNAKGGSSLELSSHDDDEELVLGSGSDITRGAGDSGISLAHPTDSGIMLDKPMDLGGSKIDSFELGEDDVISLDPDVDVEQATQLKSDDDFVLETASDSTDDFDDSGSQVIALDTEDDIASGSGGMFGSSSPGMAKMLEEDLDGDAPAAGAAAKVAGLPGGPMVAAYPTVPEAPFSIFNVLGLLACVIFLTITGMMMYELVRNMWSWNQPTEVSASMIKSMDSMFNLLDKK